MLEERLGSIFSKYEKPVQKILRDVLRLEQQYITDQLRTNSTALKEIKQKMDQVISEVAHDET